MANVSGEPSPPIPATQRGLSRWPYPLAYFIFGGLGALVLITVVVVVVWCCYKRKKRKKPNEDRGKIGTPKRSSQPKKQQSKQPYNQSKCAKKQSKKGASPKDVGDEEEDVSIIIPSEKELITLSEILKESSQQKTIPKSPPVKTPESPSLRVAMERSKALPSCTVIKSDTKSQFGSISLQEHSAKMVAGALENVLVKVKSARKKSPKVKPRKKSSISSSNNRSKSVSK